MQFSPHRSRLDGYNIMVAHRNQRNRFAANYARGGVLMQVTRPYSRQTTTIHASLVGLGAMVLLALLIMLGSRMLQHFDPALTGYAIASLFAAFGVAFHYGTWLMRPSTRIMWRRSWQFFLSWRNFRRYFWVIPITFARNLLFQTFIRQRSLLRWVMHQCLFWGVILSFAVTFPLTFGWVYFEATSEHHYVAHLFGFP